MVRVALIAVVACAACAPAVDTADDAVVCRATRTGAHPGEGPLERSIRSRLLDGAPDTAVWDDGPARTWLPDALFVDLALAWDGTHVRWRPVDEDDPRACPVEHAVEVRATAVVRLGDGEIVGFGEARLSRRSVDTDDGLVDDEEVDALLADPDVWIAATFDASLDPDVADAAAEAVGASGPPGYAEIVLSGLWPGQIAVNGVWQDGVELLASGSMLDLPGSTDP